MKKLVLLILFLLILTPYSLGAEFTLIYNDGKSKVCQILDNGYVCPGEKPVEVKNFKMLFFMPKEAVYRTLTLYGGVDTKYLQLNNGRRYESGELVLDTPIIGKKKGVIVKNENGIEDICKLEKDGQYTCNTKTFLYNPLLPENTSWTFYKSELDLQNNKPSIAYPNGYKYNDKVYYVENFQDRFYPYVYYGNPNAFKYVNDKKGYILFAEGYYIPGELPVVYKKNINYKSPEYSYMGTGSGLTPEEEEAARTHVYTVTDYRTGKVTHHTSKYIDGAWHHYDENGKEILPSPDNVKTKVIYGTNGQHYTIIEKNGRTYVRPGQYWSDVSY